jgi:hypothetical protein
MGVRSGQYIGYLQTKMFNALITLPVVLYGCETRYLTSREENRLEVFEKRVLRKVFGQEDEMTDG